MANPTLRFEKFKDTWKACRLKDMCEKITRKSKHNERKLFLYCSSEYGLTKQTAHFHKAMEEKEVNDYSLILKGEFVYCRLRTSAHPFGRVDRLEYDKGLMSPRYTCFKAKQNANPSFLSLYFQSCKWHKEIYKTSNRLARLGWNGISSLDFFNTIHNLPSLPEQKEIADFLTMIDERIETQQAIITKLKKTKKGFLSQMFC